MSDGEANIRCGGCGKDIQPGEKLTEHDCKETVNHPQHYGGDTTYEAIKVIEAWGLGFCLGNTVKYIARADHKNNRLEDLKKARWYLDREIKRVESEIGGVR